MATSQKVIKKRFPEWYINWKDDIDSKDHEARDKKKKAADIAAKEAEPAAEVKPEESPAAGGGTVCPAASPPPASSAPGTGGLVFEVGARVRANYRGGKKIAGKVVEVLSSNCWIICDGGQGADSDKRKKVLTAKLELESPPQIPPAAATADSVDDAIAVVADPAGVAGPAVQEALAVDPAAEGEAAWKDVGILWD